ncbi:microtubule-associated tumor suppressor candidate 2 homolog isoform X3 [Scleropages formosus]|nr:microtubule-associated tumor suppressor candidate 2 homolog isoform X3 [Scleropages formosus]
MSSQDNPSGPFTSGYRDNQGREVKNNNRQALFVSRGDPNANAIHAEVKSVTGDAGTLPPLVSQSEEQDKIIIWGADARCIDPDLEEFELLECQELEAFLVEEEEKPERKGNAGVGKDTLLDPRSLKEDHSCTYKEQDSQTKASDSQNIPSELYRIMPEDITQVSPATDTTSTKNQSLHQDSCCHSVPSQSNFMQSSSMDLNMNSGTLPQGTCQEAQPVQTRKGLRTGPLQEESGAVRNGSGKCQQKKICMRGDVHTQQHGFQSQNREQAGSKNYSPVNSPSSDGSSIERVLSSQLLNPVPCSETGIRLFIERDGVESQSCHWSSSSTETSVNKTCDKVNGRLCQEDIKPEQNGNYQAPSTCMWETTHSTAEESKALQKQGLSKHNHNASPSSLERRTPQTHPSGSPTRSATPPSPKNLGSPKKRLSSSPSKATGSQTSSQETVNGLQGFTSGLRTPAKVAVNSGIPKPVLQNPCRAVEKTEPESKNERSPSPSFPPKPKNVRPKIITYIRKGPQLKPQVLDTPYQVSTLPSRLSAYTSSPTTKDPKTCVDPKASPVLSASNLLYDKYRQEMQKTRFFAPGLAVSGIRPPSQTIPSKLPGKADSFYGTLAEKYLPEMGQSAVNLGTPGHEDSHAVSQFGSHEATNIFRAPRALRPQLGLGAVNRFPSAKNRMLLAGQRSSLAFSHPVQAVTPVSHNNQDTSADQRKPTAVPNPKSLLPKPGQSGLRPPGYSRLPAARLAAFGFVRSASVSSVSSNQSNDSTRSDPCHPSHRPSCDDTPPPHKTSTPQNETPRALSRNSPQPPNTPVPARRSLLPPPRSPPIASRKEVQKDADVSRPALSSPKRFAVVSPRPQSPVQTRQKPPAMRTPTQASNARPGPGAAEVAAPVGHPNREPDAAAQQLQDKCQKQARRLLGLQVELKKTTLCLEVLAISTQHFCLKSDRAIQKEKELSVELERMRDEVVSSRARLEQLKLDKDVLEESFERELRVLQEQQEAELGTLEEGLRVQHTAEKDRLRAQHQAQLEESRSQQQDQIQELTINHEVAIEEMEKNHKVTLARLKEEHAAALKELKVTHEHQKNAMEENFEKMRLSLQDQVDTLIFQNCSLRDRAKRFEEALRRSTDEQIVDVLAPYQHIEKDLKSLKEVLEMKNRQIHEQEKKISDLEKMAQKNMFLEERIQVLQQQNEDLKARIDHNLALSRQLSEENANLQEHVEKESKEKKRLSRNNEELLWRLQTGELSPHMLSPSSSPVHRTSPGPSSPSRLNPFPR